VTADKVRENRLRRMAERQGLRLQKSRRRDPRALDFGRYWLVDMETGVLDQRIEQRHGIELEDVEAWLTGEER
jgi:hypothetical protein